MKKSCKHIIGEYWHSCSELYSFRHPEEIDGLGDVLGYFKYCSLCGEKIKKSYINKLWKDYAKSIKE